MPSMRTNDTTTKSLLSVRIDSMDTDACNWRRSRLLEVRPRLLNLAEDFRTARAETWPATSGIILDKARQLSPGPLFAVEPSRPGRHDAKGDSDGVWTAGLAKCKNNLQERYQKAIHTHCTILIVAPRCGSFFEPFDACGTPRRNVPHCCELRCANSLSPSLASLCPSIH